MKSATERELACVRIPEVLTSSRETHAVLRTIQCAAQTDGRLLIE